MEIRTNFQILQMMQMYKSDIKFFKHFKTGVHFKEFPFTYHFTCIWCGVYIFFLFLKHISLVRNLLYFYYSFISLNIANAAILPQTTMRCFWDETRKTKENHFPSILHQLLVNIYRYKLSLCLNFLGDFIYENKIKNNEPLKKWRFFQEQYHTSEKKLT